MLRAVLFDLDDTLFDHRHSCRAALATLQSQFFSDVLGAISLDEMERAHHEILNEVHVEVLNGATSIDQAREKRFARLLSRYNITAPARSNWR